MISSLRNIILSSAIIASGCIAGPTPHPGTKNATDEQGQPVQPTQPGAPQAEACEQSGGRWTDGDCQATTSDPNDSLDGADASPSPQDAGVGGDTSDAEGDSDDGEVTTEGDVPPMDAGPSPVDTSTD